MKGRILIAGSDEVLVATRANILSLSYSVSTCKPEDTIECLQSATISASPGLLFNAF